MVCVVAAVLLGAVLVSWSLSLSLTRKLAWHLRVERQLDAVMSHLQVPDPDSALPAVASALDAHDKLRAVREYRIATGASPLEAKYAVDALIRRRTGPDAS